MLYVQFQSPENSEQTDSKLDNIKCNFCLLTLVPILVDSCPFEVANNWNQLNADCSQAILTKDAKTLCK